MQALFCNVAVAGAYIMDQYHLDIFLYLKVLSSEMDLAEIRLIR